MSSSTRRSSITGATTDKKQFKIFLDGEPETLLIPMDCGLDQVYLVWW